MCNHEKFKISELLFNKFEKRIGTLICCLKCGWQNKIKTNERFTKIRN